MRTKRDANFFKKMVTERLGRFNTDARPMTSKTRDQLVKEAKPRLRPQDYQTRHKAKANARPLVGATQFSSTLTDDYLIARTILEDSPIADSKQELARSPRRSKISPHRTQCH